MAHVLHTTIRFELAQTAHVDLSILTLDGRPVRQIVDEVRPATPASVGWGFGEIRPSGVYVARLIANDPQTQDRLFEDYIWMVLWQPDPDISVVGRTNENGFFATSDSLLFPNTLTLPPLQGRTVVCEPFALEIGDTFTIVLTDEYTGEQQSFLTELPDDSLKVTWDPPPVSASPSITRFGYQPSDRHRRFVVQDISTEASTRLQRFRLEQNCPNPFN